MAEDTQTQEKITQEAPTNIASTERWTTAILGGALATYGVMRRSPASYALAALGGYLVYRGANGHCPAYSALGVNGATPQTKDEVREKLGDAGIKVDHAVTVMKPVEELYAYWRDFTNLPKIMDHLEAVTVQDGKKSHWVAKAPLGSTVAWDAEIINEVPNEIIAWQSLPGANIENAGAVTFKPAPAGRGTVVRAEISYAPPAGKVGATIAHLLGEDPRRQLDDDLRHFKQIMEAGERATTEGQPSGRGPDTDKVK